MYSPHLDTPPPSRFRRPWSPDPYDPLPQASKIYQNRNQSQLPNDDQYPNSFHYSRQQRREPSDVSVEALDLAEYAKTLRPNRTNQNYQNYPDIAYPPQSPPMRPASRDSFQPPSLYRGNTLSSNTHSSGSRYQYRRPFSLPPQPTSSRRTTSPTSAISSRYPTFRDPRFSSPQIHTNSEIDISQFPAWSRSWYNDNNVLSSPPDDIYTALPKSHFDSKQSPFDPSNTWKHSSYDFDPYNGYAAISANGQDSHLLPWSNDPPEYGPVVDQSVKEERIRMLEREFGPKSKSKGTQIGPFLDEDGKPLVGTVDLKGRLVTQGPRKRTGVRVIQILLAATAAIPGIYAALVIKPKETPPPAGKLPAYVLYVFSVITLVSLLGLFLVRPCCCGRRLKGDNNPHDPLASGMMVLPVQGLPGGKKPKKDKGKKGKKGQQSGAMGDVQVNLIVDPNIFNGGQQEPESDEDENDDWEGSMPGGFDSSRRRRRRNAPRRSIFAGLAMEEQWNRARLWRKKIAAVDIAGMIIWGAIFILVLLGKRCPIGGFAGWCNAYNTSSAAACLLCVAFAISLFFDVKDLHSSKQSPRTRT